MNNLMVKYDEKDKEYYTFASNFEIKYIHYYPQIMELLAWGKVWEKEFKQITIDNIRWFWNKRVGWWGGQYSNIGNHETCKHSKKLTIVILKYNDR